MCYDADAAPPVHGPAACSVEWAEPVVLTSANGTRFAAFLARPERPLGAGVVVLPDNRGLSRFYEELTVRLAEQGHPAIAVDYFGRTAGADHRARGAEFAAMDRLMPHLTQLTAAGLDSDITTAAEHLRATAAPADGVLALGFCFGGRQAFRMAAARFGFAGVIGFYGYPGTLFGAPGPTQCAAELTAPVLAFWGGADDGIPPAAVAAFDDALTAARCPHEFVTYPGAPHGFFELGKEEFATASADAWGRVLEFLARGRTPA